MKTFQQEVVSGGTQRDAPPPEQNIGGAAGALAWLGLFAFIYLVKGPWAVVFALGLAVSIIAHEWGHYWTAKRSGMKATQFFLGFGPRIWSTHRNGVEWGVRVIPLGGFVKIIGMTNVDEVDPADEQRTYRQASYPRRMWVITAGSVMHVLIALAIVVPVYAVAGQLTATDRVTILQVAPDTPAEAAGLEAGDVILAIDGSPVTSRSELNSRLGGLAPDTSVTLSVNRDSETISLVAVLTQHPDFETTRGYLGVVSDDRERVASGFGDALVQGPKDLFDGFGQAVVGIAKVINPVNVWGHLTGTNDDLTSRPGTIVGATNISADVGEYDGWAGMLVLLAMVNLSVGVFNMFPLLPLDGGHAAIATYERLRSRRGRRYYADVNKLMPVAAISIALIAFMFLTGLYLDIAKG